MALAKNRLIQAIAILASLFFLTMPICAHASERPMTGAEIKTALTGKRVKSVGADNIQSFYASGETVYTTNGSPSQGGWDVRADFYCSV